MHMSLFAIKRLKLLTVISFLFLLSCEDKEKEETFSLIGTWEQTEYNNIDRNSGWVPYGGSLLSWEFKSDQTINFKLDATTWTVNYDYCSDEEEAWPETCDLPQCVSDCSGTLLMQLCPGSNHDCGGDLCGL